MEKMIDFLADYYIWFFVAAGILCFALIGFIIESKKKQKSEFKGESIEESISDNKVNEIETLETPNVTEPIEVVNNMEVNNDTMEINDIPIVNDEVNNSYYDAPIEMPLETPMPSPMENNVSYEEDNSNGINSTIGDPIKLDNNIENETLKDTSLIQEDNKNNFDIFEDFK